MTHFADIPYLDIATLVQMTGEPRHTIRTQLHRWCNTGRLIPLRRGMYVIPSPHRMPNPAFLANAMYAPSYITAQWALSYYGLIPEKATVFISVTTRKPTAFENPLGIFRYRHIKSDAFFGYQAIAMPGTKVLLAEPEKALLDLWHLSSGPWTSERMDEMRFQNTDRIDVNRLRQYADRFSSPRLTHAVAVWATIEPEEKGSREL